MILPSWGEELSIMNWSMEDFKEKGQITAGPQGTQDEQFEFLHWPSQTLVDLRESTFLALQNGPFQKDKIPQSFPMGEALHSLRGGVSGEKYPVSIRSRRGARNVLVLGGKVIGQQPLELPWRIMKHAYDGDGIRVESPGDKIVDGAHIENVEDGFSPRGKGAWSLRNTYMHYIRDDFVENDGLLSGEIVNCLADQVFVFVSARPGKNANPEILDARTPPMVSIRDSLVHLSPMPHDGDMKGKERAHIEDGKVCGKLFKWSRWGGTVEVSDCIFRVDGMSSSGKTSMGFPRGSYKNVTLIWLGEGDYPAKLPDGITVSRDVELWVAARERWLQQNTPRI